MGSHELKLRVYAPAISYDPNKTNEVSITVIVEEDCVPVKFGFDPALPANFDVNFDTTFPKVSLPTGLKFQFL